jgi:hypothetical protein
VDIFVINCLVIREHHPELPYNGRAVHRLYFCAHILKEGLNCVMFKHPHSVEHESDTLTPFTTRTESFAAEI